jgi:FAD/FMN-containing dehydrogenase
VSISGYDDLERYKKAEKQLEPWIYEKVGELQGSVSAEHGIGSIKAPYLS